MTQAVLLVLLVLAVLMAVTTLGLQRLRRKLEAALHDERIVRRGTEARAGALLEDVARAQAEIEFRSRLLNAVGQGVLGTDLDGRIVYCNQAAASLLACDPHEVVRMPIVDLLPDARADAEDATMQRLRSGEPWSGEMIVRRRDGSLLPIMVTDSPIFDEHEQRIGMARIAVDLSPREHAERASRLLADAGAQLAGALNSDETLHNVTRMAVPSFADACIVGVLDDEGRPHRTEAASVVSASESLARDLCRRYGPTADASSPVARVIRESKTLLMQEVTDDDLERVASDDEHLRLLKSFGARSAIHVPLIAAGRTIGALSFFMTVSSRRFDERDVPLAEELGRRAALAIDHARLYESAVLANQAKADFIAVMSHELRTPLTTIMGYTDLLLTGLPEPVSDKARGYLERTRAAAWHLLGVIEQILVYTRVEAGTETVQPQRVQVKDVLNEAARLIEPVAGERGLDFRVDLTGAETAIETDLLMLRQILLNLLSNAVKFTDRGSVRLRARPDADAVVFEVIDTGVGIAAEHQERVFEAFWQIDQSATRHKGGTGLGLTVSRRLARMLGGDVTVDSEPGWGATFRVRLPYEWLLGGEAGGGGGGGEGGGGGGRRGEGGGEGGGGGGGEGGGEGGGGGGGEGEEYKERVGRKRRRS